MKMTVHQRLRAQRMAEHSRAVWRAHRRAVTWCINGGGIRCPDCWDVPLTAYEEARMSEAERADHKHAVTLGRRWAADPIEPCADDPKHWHIQRALGYT